MCGNTLMRKCGLAMAVVVLIGSTAFGESPDSVLLDDVVRQVVAQNDRLAAMRYMAEAAQYRSGPAGAWDDPMLMLGVANLPTSLKFDRCFGGRPRRPESPITQREMDLAASIQAVLEEIMEKIVRFARKNIDSDNLCLAGGVALNCVANGRILRETWLVRRSFLPLPIATS